MAFVLARFPGRHPTGSRILAHDNTDVGTRDRRYRFRAGDGRAFRGRRHADGPSGSRTAVRHFRTQYPDTVAARSVTFQDSSRP